MLVLSTKKKKNVYLTIISTVPTERKTQRVQVVSVNGGSGGCMMMVVVKKYKNQKKQNKKNKEERKKIRMEERCYEGGVERRKS